MNKTTITTILGAAALGLMKKGSGSFSAGKKATIINKSYIYNTEPLHITPYPNLNIPAMIESGFIHSEELRGDLAAITEDEKWRLQKLFTDRILAKVLSQNKPALIEKNINVEKIEVYDEEIYGQYSLFVDYKRTLTLEDVMLLQDYDFDEVTDDGYFDVFLGHPLTRETWDAVNNVGHQVSDQLVKAMNRTCIDTIDNFDFGVIIELEIDGLTTLQSQSIRRR